MKKRSKSGPRALLEGGPWAEPGPPQAVAAAVRQPGEEGTATVSVYRISCAHCWTTCLQIRTTSNHAVFQVEGLSCAALRVTERW